MSAPALLSSFALCDVLPLPIWYGGSDGKADYFNQAWLNFTGHSLEQELGWGWLENLLPEERSATLDTFRAALAASQPFRFQYHLRSREGIYRQMMAKSVPLSLLNDQEERKDGWLTISYQLVDTPLPDESLVYNEARFERFFEKCPLPAAIRVSEGHYLHINQAIERAFQATIDELRMGQGVALPFEARLRASSDQGEGVIESVRVSMGTQGEEVSWRVFEFPFQLDEPDKPAVVGMVAWDVTETETELTRLRTNQEQLQSLFDHSLDAILIVNDGGQYLDANPAACELLGYSREEMLQLKISDITPESTQRRRSELWKRFIRESEQSGLYAIRARSGEIRQVEFRAVANILPGVHASVLRDVTERQIAEEALWKSRLQLLEAQRLTHLGSWEWDMETDVLLWSDELYRVFGLNAETFQPTFQSVLERIHPEDRALVRPGVEKALHGDGKYNVYHRIMRPDGAIRIVHSQGNLFYDEMGRPLGILGTAQDVTEQKQAEEEKDRLFEQVRTGREQLKNLSHQLVKIQEAERRAIARELHDEIGQALTGLKLLLETDLKLMLETEGEQPVVVTGSRQGEAISIIEDLMARVRELSLNLRPAMLDDLGLLPTLLWHFERYTLQTQIKVDFKQSGLKQRLPASIETASYRIVQEALTNVARHAKVTEVKVRIAAEETVVNLEIEDNGAGFDTEALQSNVSNGLTGMRERAALLQGWLTIISEHGKGTRLVAQFPLDGVGERRRVPR